MVSHVLYGAAERALAKQLDGFGPMLDLECALRRGRFGEKLAHNVKRLPNFGGALIERHERVHHRSSNVKLRAASHGLHLINEGNGIIMAKLKFSGDHEHWGQTCEVAIDGRKARVGERKIARVRTRPLHNDVTIGPIERCVARPTLARCRAIQHWRQEHHRPRGWEAFPCRRSSGWPR